MYNVYLKNMLNGLFDTCKTFTTIDEAFQFAANKAWGYAVIHNPAGAKIAAYTHGRVDMWDNSYVDYATSYGC